MKFLYHDLIVRGTVCNLRCSYCTSTEAARVYVPEPSPLLVADKRGRINIQETLGVVDQVRGRIDAPLLKLSGGELFLYPNALALVEELSVRYAHVQLVTNGTALKKDDIDRVAGLGNVGFNLSLDGHLPEMNDARWKAPSVTAAVLRSLARILERLGELEITSVITDANAARYGEFLDFLSRAGGRPVAVPIPVRGVHAPELFSRPSRMEFAAFLRRAHETYRQMLGPALYYQELARFLDEHDGVRRTRCHIANLAIQAFDSGTLTPCPVGWTVSLGNLREDDPEAVLDQVGQHKMYDLLTRPRPRVPVCRSCYSVHDMINLFIVGSISLDDLSRMPMYRATPVQARLVEVRDSLRVAVSEALPGVAEVETN